MKRLNILASLLVTFVIAQVLPIFWTSSWGYWFSTLPGTFAHESAHWLFAAALGGDPTGFSIFPTFDGRSMSSLGHVLFQPSSLNAAAVALAPLHLAVVAVWLVILSARCAISARLLLCYVAVCCWQAMWPSGADWAIARSWPASFGTFAAFCVPSLFALRSAVLRILT